MPARTMMNLQQRQNRGRGRYSSRPHNSRPPTRLARPQDGSRDARTCHVAVSAAVEACVLGSRCRAG